VPIIYFATDSSTLLPSMKQTGAEVIGLDWRIPLDEGGTASAATALFKAISIRSYSCRLERIEIACGRYPETCRRRPGHIFNLGHGILPETPVENVKALTKFVQEHSGSTG